MIQYASAETHPNFEQGAMRSRPSQILTATEKRRLLTKHSEWLAMLSEWRISNLESNWPATEEPTAHSGLLIEV